MPSPLSNTTRIYQIVFGALLLGFGFMITKQMMFSGVGKLKFATALFIWAAIALALDYRYWLLVPVLGALGVRIPNMPFTPEELGPVVFLAIYLLRSGLQKDIHDPIPKIVWIAVPYCLWTLVSFVLNPPGLNMFGAETMGGRYYFDIYSSFIFLLFFSTIRITEKDCRFWFWCVLVVSVFTALKGLYGGLADMYGDGAGGTHYKLIGFSMVLLLLLCKWRLSEIFISPSKIGLCAILFFLSIYSGKRTAAGRIVLAPFFLSLFRRKDRGATFWCAVAGSILLLLMISGHSLGLYRLPYSVQRAVSWVPGRWKDSRLEELGTSDLFRRELQSLAKEEIRRSPWVGRKGFAMKRGDITWTIARGGGQHFGQHAMSGNWHNKFYGMGADFGLPASFAWYYFSIAYFIFCFRNLRRYRPLMNTYAYLLLLYFGLEAGLELVFTFGQSALTPLNMWKNLAFTTVVIKTLRTESPLLGFKEANEKPAI